MQTWNGLGRFGVVAGITCVLLLGSPGLTTAQRRSTDRTLLFAPHDVGEGLSQMIPVVTAVLLPGTDKSNREGALVGVEQPELHLNPKQQAALGDALLHGALRSPKNVLIVETHSEHLILRILRRIRETGQGKPHNGMPVDPQHVGIWHVDKEGGPSDLSEIGVDVNGDFTRAWPDSFFEQDFLERFAE